MIKSGNDRSEPVRPKKRAAPRFKESRSSVDSINTIPPFVFERSEARSTGLTSRESPKAFGFFYLRWNDVFRIIKILVASYHRIRKAEFLAFLRFCAKSVSFLSPPPPPRGRDDRRTNRKKRTYASGIAFMDITTHDSERSILYIFRSCRCARGLLRRTWPSTDSASHSTQSDIS